MLAFNANNRIQSLTDIDGNALSFTYAGNVLTQIKDAYNRTLTLSYTSGKLTQAADNQGRSVTYSYNGTDLTSFHDPENKAWQYGYDSGHQILTVTVSGVYDICDMVNSLTAPSIGGISNSYVANYF
ncbi:MAG: hypothetical protein Q8Q45_16660 [Methylococcaceae bacterium]|nr:hypothetical protein [Methylococcaceae bacterium]MDP3390120.1 hypothetical protein [Methylococcaceae bacterium]MDP3933971.1 hypothetical protein [Methylococcaceae bacterium]MDZ4155001.1 hypothetical protein [Methylococcales bacterium]